jgi:hypothetical protein
MTTGRPLRASSVRARTRELLFGAVLALAACTAVSAHRLDEYLQAARIDLRLHDVSIDLDLTPGAALAESLIASIDRDGDSVTSLDEQRAYATEILGELDLRLDGVPLAPQLTSSAFPALDALRRGEGTIRLQLNASHDMLASGRHQLFFDNRHLTRQSLYLANALVPATTSMSVIKQLRSADQRELTIHYSVASTLASTASNGLLLGVVSAVLLVRYTRRNGTRS